MRGEGGREGKGGREGRGERKEGWNERGEGVRREKE